MLSHKTWNIPIWIDLLADELQASTCLHLPEAKITDVLWYAQLFTYGSGSSCLHNKYFTCWAFSLAYFCVCMCGDCFVVLCVGIFCLCVYLCTLCLVLTETRRGHHTPGTGVTDVCELLCGLWELNLGLLEEQPVLSIISLSLICCFLKTPDIVQAGILTPELSCAPAWTSHMVGYRYRPWWPTPAFSCCPIWLLYTSSHSPWIIKLVWHVIQETQWSSQSLTITLFSWVCR